MSRKWVKFTEGPILPTRNRPHVTLNGKGVFQFNRLIFQMLGSPKAAVLYFDEESSIIGITAAHPQLREAFPVNVKDVYWTINAIPFCRRFGIKIEKTQAFADPDLDNRGYLQLD